MDEREDWRFDLVDPGRPARAQIPGDEVERLRLLVDPHAPQPESNSSAAEVPAVMTDWMRRGFTLDQIAVAARLSLARTRELLGLDGP